MSRTANRMLRYLLPVMLTIRLRDFVGPPAWPELDDADDEPLWAAAVLGEALYVVSENTRHFPPLVDVTGPEGDRERRHVHAGVEYVTAIEFIEDVLGQDAAALYGEPVPTGLVRGQRSASRSPSVP